MTKLFWWLSIYLVTVGISYPFIKLDAKKMEMDGRDKEVWPYNIYWLAMLMAFIPVINLLAGFLGYIKWKRYGNAANRLKKLSKRIKDLGYPDLSEMMDDVANNIINYNKFPDHDNKEEENQEEDNSPANKES